MATILSPADTRLLSLAAAGLTDKAIAREVGLSHYTVMDHMKRIRAQLGAKNRAAAAVAGVETRVTAEVAEACAALCEARAINLTNESAYVARGLAAAIRAQFANAAPRRATTGAANGNDTAADHDD